MGKSADIDLSIIEVAQGFSALGSEHRVEVLLVLVRAGDDGMTVGAIQKRLGTPASTLAHHLRFLSAAGLIEREKSGRSVVARAKFTQIKALAGYLLRECCHEDENFTDTDW